MLPFDLHVLSMPPAFNLSQDQTLQFNLAVIITIHGHNNAQTASPVNYSK